MSTKLTRSRMGAVALAATVAAGAAVPGSASAAKVGGTVVAKDAKRGTVVLADAKGAVKTVRAKGIARVRIGQNVTANATLKGDGTYAAPKVNRRGKARKSARIRGTVVRRAGGRIVLSAGSSTFAIRSAPRARAASATTTAPGVGDIVDARVRLNASGVAASTVKKVGEASRLELEGIVIEVGEGVLKVAVAGRGAVTIAVPEGRQVSAAVGDEVEALVSIGAGDAFTLVALFGDDDGRDEDGDYGIDFSWEDGEVEVAGVITALTADSVTVSAGPDASVTCAVPAGTSLDGFQVGERVELDCRVAGEGVYELVEMESENHEVEVDREEEDEDGDDDAGANVRDAGERDDDRSGRPQTSRF